MTWVILGATKESLNRTTNPETTSDSGIISHKGFSRARPKESPCLAQRKHGTADLEMNMGGQKELDRVETAHRDVRNPEFGTHGQRLAEPKLVPELA